MTGESEAWLAEASQTWVDAATTGVGFMLNGKRVAPEDVYAPPATTTLQQLHDLEIPGGIEWTFDGAWRVWIGNPMRDEANVGSEAEALEWLDRLARELYFWSKET